MSRISNQGIAAVYFVLSDIDGIAEDRTRRSRRIGVETSSEKKNRLFDDEPSDRGFGRDQSLIW